VHLINYALHQVTQQGTARSLQHQLKLRVAGKTGTSDDFRDSWFAGFSDDRLAVVWVGRDDNQSTGLTGASGALRLWTQLMKNIPARDLQLDMPESVINQWIDPETGGSTDKGCSGAVELPFITGSGPTQRAECKSRTLMERLKGFFD
jgi:penicillin-binding protein 1B